MSIEAWIEAKSEHPIAVAIVQTAEQQNISLLSITALASFASVTELGIKASPYLYIHTYLLMHHLLMFSFQTALKF